MGDDLVVEDLELTQDKAARNSKRGKVLNLYIYYDNIVSVVCPFQILGGG